ncbi:class I adenylate-forming enzyme family protein [Streptomyces sp. NPDC050145]|uniref:class I adenylate-forming enzyme family protein n=1 Tax=Streptomyces sp. NPDC050145 TaxID=3365602 RepID=UPI00379AAFF7
MTRTTLDYPTVDVGAVLAGAAHQYEHRVAVRHGEQCLTFGQLHDQALRFAGGLREHGIQPGDTVLMLLTNSLWFPVAYWGALYAGAVVSPANPAQPARALADQIADSGAHAVVTDPTSLPSVEAAGATNLRLTVATAGESTTEHDVVTAEALLRSEVTERVVRRPDDLAHLSYTGGTTGRSKAVRVLHRNLVANATQITWARGASRTVLTDGLLHAERDSAAATRWHQAPGCGSTLAVAPLFHALGLVSLVYNTLLGSTIVLSPRFDPARFITDVNEHQITFVNGSPTMYRALLAAPASEGQTMESVTIVNSGAAPIDPETVRRLSSLFPNALITEGYGCTEATMALAMHPIDSETKTPSGSVGRAVPDTELSIRDLLDPERELPVGETGELWARGPQIADGYHGRDDLTAEQFQDGWLRTGDIGRLDEQGFLFLSGRAKDMLIYKGYNVYPLHLEDVLAGHPAVATAAVIGTPHAQAGEIPTAYVVLRPGASVSAEELMAYVADHVAPYQRVREVHFIEALPVTAAGKILKNELRGRHTGQGQPPAP